MHPHRTRWVTDSPVPSFIIQSVISTLGAILIGVLAVLIPAILVAATTKNTSGGNFADHISEPILALAGEPYFITPVAAGFLLGIFSRRFFHSRSGALVWIIPMAILMCGLATWKTGGFRPYWKDVWQNYFSSQCEASECAYEWLVTAPFYTSLAYTFGWLINGFVRHKRRGVSTPLGTEAGGPGLTA